MCKIYIASLIANKARRALSWSDYHLCHLEGEILGEYRARSQASSQISFIK